MLSACLLLGLAIPVLFLTVLQSKTILSVLQNEKARYFYHTGDTKDIALTIDDGPHPNITNKILDTLKKHNTKATFFLIGLRVKMYPDVVKRIIRDGHSIANHDYFDQCSLLRSSFEDSFMKTHQLVRSYTIPKYFRPGCGLYSSRMTDFITTKGYKMILGNIYPHDVVFGRYDIGKIFLQWYLPWRVSPGSIMILHDSRDSLRTDQVLDSVIPHLQGQGYTFRTIDEMESQYPDV